MFHQRVDLVGAERIGQIVRSDCLVGSAADPRISLFVEARLLKLLEQVVQATAQDAAGRAASEEASEPALEEVTQPAPGFLGRGDIDLVAGLGRRGLAGGGWRARLSAAKGSHRLIGKKAEYCHGDWRHAGAGAATAGRRGWGLPVRAMLHPPENIHQTHDWLLLDWVCWCERIAFVMRQ